METNKENSMQETKQLCSSEVYEKPAIEIIEMELESNILTASSDNPGSSDDFLPGGGSSWDW